MTWTFYNFQSFFRPISSTTFIRTISYVTSTNSGSNKFHQRGTTSPTHLCRTTIVRRHCEGYKRSKDLRTSFYLFADNINVAIVPSAFNKKRSVNDNVDWFCNANILTLKKCGIFVVNYILYNILNRDCPSTAILNEFPSSISLKGGKWSYKHSLY